MQDRLQAGQQQLCQRGVLVSSSATGAAPLCWYGLMAPAAPAGCRKELILTGFEAGALLSADLVLESVSPTAGLGSE